MIGYLSPVIHPTQPNLIRLPLRSVLDQYIVYVADGLVRYYNNDTLPNALKERLAMILAAPQPMLIDESSRHLQKLSIYTNTMSDAFDTIGWRVSETYFCLIVDDLILNSLISGTVNRTDDGKDT